MEQIQACHAFLDSRRIGNVLFSSTFGQEPDKIGHSKCSGTSNRSISQGNGRDLAFRSIAKVGFLAWGLLSQAIALPVRIAACSSNEFMSGQAAASFPEFKND